MEARELRIGNLVDETGDIVPVGKRTFKYWDELNLSKILEPIPLTEEWLLRFGFEISVSMDIKCWCIDGISAIRERKKGMFDYNLLQLESVHQLQNLYYALTGKELEVKELTIKETV